MNTGEFSCVQALICLVLFGPPVSAAALSIVPTDPGISEARVFNGPLLPAGGAASTLENRDLARALESVVKSRDPEPFRAVADFLGKHPRSGWGASLLVNMGTVY